MGIRTKFNPMGGKSGKRYKAYLLIDGVATDVATLGFAENIDPDKCFGSTKSSIDNKYVILNGKLFNYSSSTLNQVGSANTWTAIEGGGATACGISDGKIYKITNYSTVAQIGNYTNCTALGTHTSNTLSSYAGVYFISDEKLYFHTSGTSASQVGSNATWTEISGNGVASGTISTYGVGINNNKPNYIRGTTASAVNINVNKLSGVLIWTASGSSGNWSAFYFIDTNGKLYGYGGGSTIGQPISGGGQVGSLTTWTDITGYYSMRQVINGYGVANGEAYKLAGTGATKIGSLNTWTSVSGVYKQNTYYAYGIADNDLYLITNATESKLLDNCLKVYGFGTGLAICEA